MQRGVLKGTVLMQHRPLTDVVQGTPAAIQGWRWVGLGRKHWSGTAALLISILLSSSSRIFHETTNFKPVLLEVKCGFRTL